MRAAICYQFGKPLVIEEIQPDPPRSGEVLVRIVERGGHRELRS